MLSKTSLKSIVILGTSSIFVSSCSTSYTYKKPESFEEKMSRYESRTMNTNIVPEVQIKEKFSYRSKKNRSPASVTENDQQDFGLNQYNNKRLYFLTLYSQYRDMMPLASHKAVGQDLNHCPSFHTSYLNFKESAPESVTTRDYKFPIQSMDMLKNSDYMASYPEFYLPIAKGSTHPRVIDVALKDNLSISQTKELIKNSLNTHISKTFSELNELCDTGSSTNYYIYENLLTHSQTMDKISANKVGLKTLLKTTLFSNMTLTNSIKRNQKVKSRGIASYVHKQHYDQEVMKRLNVSWVNNYLQSK